jgi:hypothetical protein
MQARDWDMIRALLRRLRARRAGSHHPPPTLVSWTCPHCCSDAVACLERDRRAVLLRCGECGVWRETVMTPAAFERFERHLAGGTADIAQQLKHRS